MQRCTMHFSVFVCDERITLIITLVTDFAHRLVFKVTPHFGNRMFPRKTFSGTSGDG
jgi:hypothetical protein